MKISVLCKVQVGIYVPLYKCGSLLGRYFSHIGRCQCLPNGLFGTGLYFWSLPHEGKTLSAIANYFMDMDALLLKFASAVASKGNKRILCVRRKICQIWEGVAKHFGIPLNQKLCGLLSCSQLPIVETLEDSFMTLWVGSLGA